MNVRGALAFDNDLMGEQRARLDTAVIDMVRGVDGVAAAEGHIESYAQVVDKDGEPMGDPAIGVRD